MLSWFRRKKPVEVKKPVQVELAFEPKIDMTAFELVMLLKSIVPAGAWGPVLRDQLWAFEDDDLVLDERGEAKNRHFRRIRSDSPWSV